MAKMQAEADQRVVAILQRLTKMPNSAPTQHKGRATFLFIDDAQPECATQGLGGQDGQKPARAAQPTWANVVGTGVPTAAGCATVTNGKRKLKKRSLEQRRILFARNVQPHTCDPRDIMFEVNKALEQGVI